MEEEKEEIKEIKETKHSKLKIIILIILFIIGSTYIYIRYIATSGFIVKEYSINKVGRIINSLKNKWFFFIVIILPCSLLSIFELYYILKKYLYIIKI